MENQEGRLGCRVVLFPQPLVGHATPMLHVGNALYSKGFSINVIQSHLYSLNPTAFPIFTFHYIDETLWSPQVLDPDPWEMVRLLNKSFVVPFRDSLSKILRDASNDKEPVACLISDPLWDFVGMVADEFNLPRLALRTGGLLALLFMTHCHFCTKKAISPSKIGGTIVVVKISILANDSSYVSKRFCYDSKA